MDVIGEANKYGTESDRSLRMERGQEATIA